MPKFDLTAEEAKELIEHVQEAFDAIHSLYSVQDKGGCARLPAGLMPWSGPLGVAWQEIHDAREILNLAKVNQEVA